MLDGRQSQIWTSCPGIVTAVDFSEMTCSVQPAIQGIIEHEDGTEEYVDLPLLIHVPIVFPSAGGFTLTLPLKALDEVLVSFANRCIDAWWQSSGVQRPMEARMHDISDGFAIPGPHSKPRVLSGISSTGAQLRNDAGTAYIEISADGSMKMVMPAGKTFAVTGKLTVSSTIVATGEITGNGKALSTHTHPYSWTGSPGSGNTGAPT